MLNQSNAPVLYSAPSNTKYNEVYKEVNDNNIEPKCFATHIILGDKEESYDNTINSAPLKSNKQMINVLEDDKPAAEKGVLTTKNKVVPGEKLYVSAEISNKSSDTNDHSKILNL